MKKFNLKKTLKDPYQQMLLMNDIKKFALAILQIAIIVGVSYVILAPVIGMFVNAISSDKDVYNPMVFCFPENPTLEKIQRVILRMEYWPTITKNIIYILALTAVQVVVCSMVGYGFARFEFPFKKLLFGCVVVTIVLPVHTIMLPMYVTFRNFDPLGIISLIKGTPLNLMGTPWPMFILSFLACGVRSGLYIYIFNQFFRGLPKEIEEAAFVDGAGMWYTYFNIMLKNASPAVITVTVFSLVWQFNDTFYSNLFLVSEKIVISKRITTLMNLISLEDKIMEKTLQQVHLHAGIILILLPIILIYLLLQRYFIEGVERSGIVG